MLAEPAPVQIIQPASPRPGGRTDAGGGIQAAEAAKPPVERKDFERAARFDRPAEDYREFRDLPPRAFPLSLKEMPVGSNAWLSLGGDYRLRIDSYTATSFGLRGPPGFTSVQNRLLVHANLEVGSELRAFVQLGAGTEDGRRPGPRPGDRGAPDLAQGFVEYAPAGSAAKPRLRVGRQEFVLGRYVSIREATNFRRAFDGVRLDASPGRWTTTAFIGQQVANRTGAFDDDSGRRDRVALLSADHPLFAGLRLQGTFIDRRSENAAYVQASGIENRRTYSARLSGGRAPWTVDIQATYQEGSLRDGSGARSRISAWGVALQGEVDVAAPLSPRLGLRIDTASGDRDARDGTIGTFDIPYPNLAYLNDATIFAPRNNRDVQPYVTLHPSTALSLTIGDELLWRNRRGDAIYNPANMPIVPPGTGGGLVAQQPYVRSTLKLSPLISLQFSYVHAFRGPVLRRAGATRDLDFVLGAALLRF